MDALFAGLTKRQAMLLLATVTFGGQEGVEVFDFLPQEESELLRDKATQILAIPREKRVPFLVQEIKRVITGQKLGVLRYASPQRVSEALEGERPAMVEVILRALPRATADEARRRLSAPHLELKHQVHREILAVIRWKFEEKLSRTLPSRPVFTPSDLVAMPTKDLLHVADVLGAKAIARLLAPLEKTKRDDILKQLSPEQRQIATRPLTATPQPLTRERARQLLEKALLDFEPKLAVRRLGIRRIAKSCLSQSPELAARIVEHHRDDFGRQLARLASEERQKNPRGDSKERSELLAELADLAAQGIVERPVRLPAVAQPREAKTNERRATLPPGKKMNANALHVARRGGTTQPDSVYRAGARTRHKR